MFATFFVVSRSVLSVKSVVSTAPFRLKVEFKTTDYADDTDAQHPDRRDALSSCGCGPRSPPLTHSPTDSLLTHFPTFADEDEDEDEPHSHFSTFFPLHLDSETRCPALDAVPRCPLTD